MRRVSKLSSSLLIALVLAQPAWATTYAIDPKHSTISFTIRHLFSNVHGTFDAYNGQFEYVPDHPEQWTAAATIQAGSINTRVADRDQHLRSKDFFEAETYPAITFTSTEITDATAIGAKLHGTLTMHGVARPVTLDLVIHGEGKDARGTMRSGLTATTTIDRKEFGIVWNKALDTGGAMLGDDVTVVIDIEGVAAE